jgi:signal peptidase II
VSSGAGSEGATRPARPAPRWLAPLIVVVVVAADQVTKAWVVAALTGSPLSIIGDDVELRVIRNSGGAFSIFTGATLLLAIVAVVLVVVLVRTVRRARDLLTVVSLSLILGGALGNLCDRVFRAPGFLRGHVVDYVRVGSFPSFNVADSAITIGAILLVIASFRGAGVVHTGTPGPPGQPGIGAP